MTTTTTTTKGPTVSTPHSSADTYDGPAGVYGRGGFIPPTLVVPTKRERLTAALGHVVTGLELLEVLAPKLIELVADVREVLELDAAEQNVNAPGARGAA